MYGKDGYVCLALFLTHLSSRAALDTPLETTGIEFRVEACSLLAVRQAHSHLKHRHNAFGRSMPELCKIMTKESRTYVSEAHDRMRTALTATSLLCVCGCVLLVSLTSLLAAVAYLLIQPHVHAQNLEWGSTCVCVALVRPTTGTSAGAAGRNIRSHQ